MTADELRSEIRRTPFEPFLLNVTDGRRILVTSRDLILVSPLGRAVHVFQPTPDDDRDIVDMAAVTGITRFPPAGS